MVLSHGTRLGQYEILSLIGAGGLGEVYRARDPRLNRDFAIKVSSEKLSKGQNRDTGRDACKYDAHFFFPKWWFSVYRP